jgi:hypothetical protein
MAGSRLGKKLISSSFRMLRKCSKKKRKKKEMKDIKKAPFPIEGDCNGQN